jgi:MFS family permease
VDRAGAVLGAIALPMAIAGALAAGHLGDRAARRETTGGHARLLLWASVLAAPCCIAMPLMPNGYAAVVMLAGGTLFAVAGFALPQMAIQAIAPNRMRGQLTGLLLMLTGLVGYGVGPAVAGLVSDALGSLPRALALVAGATLPAAALVAYLGLAAYERAAEEAARRR